MRGLRCRASSHSFPAAPRHVCPAVTWLHGPPVGALNGGGKNQLAQGMGLKEGVDAAGVILPPIRVSSP